MGYPDDHEGLYPHNTLGRPRPILEARPRYLSLNLIYIVEYRHERQDDGQLE
jgi:hypothetical protein